MAKRKKPEIKERIGHMLKAMDEIEEFTEGMSLEEFENDRRTALAVEKLFEIMGEAAYKIDKSFKEEHHTIEWAEIEGTRHILVHNYYEVVPKILWNVKEVYFEDLWYKLKKLYDTMQ